VRPIHLPWGVNKWEVPATWLPRTSPKPSDVRPLAPPKPIQDQPRLAPAGFFAIWAVWRLWAKSAS